MASGEAARPAASAASRAKVASSSLALATVLLAFVLEGLFFALTANMNRDEGWYLLAGRLVYDGQTLYKDFPYFQGPLLPYVYGAPQAAFGSGLLIGRLTALAMGCATAGLVAYTGHRLSGLRTATWGVVFLMVTPMFMVFSVAARSEAAVIPLTLLALTLTLRFPRGFAGFAGAPLALLLATAVRLTFFPAFAASLVYAYWRAKPSRAQAVAGAALLLVVALSLYLPSFVADGNGAFFNLWTSQVSRANQFEPNAPSLGGTFLDRMTVLNSYWFFFFLFLVPAIVAGAHIVARYRAGWRPASPAFDADPLSNYALILGVALATWLPHLALRFQEPRYALPAVALLAVLVADMFVRSHHGDLGEIGRTVFHPLIAGLFAIALVFNAAIATSELSARDPELPETDDAGTYLSGLVPPDARFVTLDPTLAVAANRDVAPGLEMGHFSFWPVLNPRDVERYGVVNRARLEQIMLAPETDVIALAAFDFVLVQFASRPDELDFSERDLPFQVFPRLKGKYRIVRTFPRFGQYDDTLYILQRTP